MEEGCEGYDVNGDSFSNLKEDIERKCYNCKVEDIDVVN